MSSVFQRAGSTESAKGAVRKSESGSVREGLHLASQEAGNNLDKGQADDESGHQLDLIRVWYTFEFRAIS